MWFCPEIVATGSPFTITITAPPNTIAGVFAQTIATLETDCPLVLRRSHVYAQWQWAPGSYVPYPASGPIDAIDGPPVSVLAVGTLMLGPGPSQPSITLDNSNLGSVTTLFEQLSNAGVIGKSQYRTLSTSDNLYMHWEWPVFGNDIANLMAVFTGPFVPAPHVVQLPAGIEAGDLLIAAVAVDYTRFPEVQRQPLSPRACDVAP